MTFAEPSIKSLFLEMRFEGQVLASGSGFLVQNARHLFLVTNRHNVTGRKQRDTGSDFKDLWDTQPARVKVVVALSLRQRKTLSKAFPRCGANVD